MKYLIVNGDDLGASSGVTRGILEAHDRGVLTSASLLVDTPWSAEAAAACREIPGLSVGLHADLRDVLLEDAETPPWRLRVAIEAQRARFERLMDRLPTHLDAHHNLHRDPRALPHFLELAQRLGVPLREHSGARYFSKFYGEWGGMTHPEQISLESLERMLAFDIEEGITELSCHPGYAEPGFSSSYFIERELELETLCDPALRRVLAKHSIQLISYHEYSRLQGPAAA